VTANVGIYDRFGSFFNAYWTSGYGVTVGGTVPVVDPFAHGWPVKVRVSRTVRGEEVGTVPALTEEDGPAGALGTKTTQLVEMFNGGAPYSVVRFGTCGNSRAVFRGNALLITKAGTVTSRNFPINYNEYGVAYCDAMYNGNIIGAYKPAISDDTIGGFGFDCSTNGILCKDSGGSTVAASVAFVSRATMLPTTLGSRGWPTSSEANTVDGDAASYVGNGNMQLLKPGYSARWMWRPEAGTPNTAALKVGVVLRGFAGSTSIAAVNKVTTASAQNGAAVATTAAIIPTVGTPTAAKAAIAVVNPVYISARDHPTTVGSITVDDSDNGWATVVAGDLLRHVGAYEQVVIRSISGKGTASCVVTYEWRMVTHPIIGNTFQTLPATDSYKVIEVDFAAGEATGSQWRGIEIKAGTEAGCDGLLVACIYAYRTDGNGAIVQWLGRHGCGHHVQAARHGNVVSARDGKTEHERCMDILQTDVIFLAAADQGFTSQQYDTAFLLQRSRYAAARPTIEFVYGQCMPESQSNNWQNDGPTKPSYTKNGVAAAMYSAAAVNSDPCVGWWLDEDGVQCCDTFATGKDIGESPTHPLTGTVIEMWFRQLTTLILPITLMSGNLRALLLMDD
jgi:hypothetical protein